MSTMKPWGSQALVLFPQGIFPPPPTPLTPGCSVETLAGSGEEHQVVGQHPEVTFPLPALVGAPAQGAAQPPLVPAERGLRLPALAVDPPVAAAPRPLAEPRDHLPPVRGLRPLPAPAAAVERDPRGADAAVR